MAYILVLFFSLLGFSQHHHGDVPSTHGMVILGEKTIYLSHLPMFHAPHDYQVIVEAALDEKAMEIYQDSLQSEKLCTLVPETFVLPEMIAKPRPFKAEIYAGHFERGGQLIAEATVQIKKVILFRKLDPKGKRPQNSQYFLFGNSSEQFLAHKISARPDFDHLLKVNMKLIGNLEEKTFSFPDTQPLTGLGVEIYFETGDLSH